MTPELLSMMAPLYGGCCIPDCPYPFNSYTAYDNQPSGGGLCFPQMNQAEGPITEVIPCAFYLCPMHKIIMGLIPLVYGSEKLYAEGTTVDEFLTKVNHASFSAQRLLDRRRTTFKYNKFGSRGTLLGDAARVLRDAPTFAGNDIEVIEAVRALLNELGKLPPQVRAFRFYRWRGTDRKFEVPSRPAMLAYDSADYMARTLGMFKSIPVYGQVNQRKTFDPEAAYLCDDSKCAKQALHFYAYVPPKRTTLCVITGFCAQHSKTRKAAIEISVRLLLGKFPNQSLEGITGHQISEETPGRLTLEGLASVGIVNPPWQVCRLPKKAETGVQKAVGAPIWLTQVREAAQTMLPAPQEITGGKPSRSKKKAPSIPRTPDAAFMPAPRGMTGTTEDRFAAMAALAPPKPPKTSDTHPIEAAQIPVPTPGKLFVTFAPGKTQASSFSGQWDRDVEKDLTRLRDVYGVTDVLSLVEPFEYDMLQMGDYPNTVVSLGLAFHALPIKDGSVPTDIEAFKQTVGEMADLLTEGRSVVVHCKGGLGRAGITAAAIASVLGFDGDAKALIDLIRQHRSKHAIENGTQERFVAAFHADVNGVPFAPEANVMEVSGALDPTFEASIAAWEQGGPDIGEPPAWLMEDVPVMAPPTRSTRAPKQAPTYGYPYRDGKTWSASSVDESRAIGALVGLACGDAVGTTLEFSKPDPATGLLPPSKWLTDMVGGGPFGLMPGGHTDDTSMALALGESLCAKGWDPKDQMNRFVDWMDNGAYSVKGYCFDIGGATSSALNRYKKTGNPVAGSPNAGGNGCLMRIAPIAIYYAHQSPQVVAQKGADEATLTHGFDDAQAACAYFVVLLQAAMEGVSALQMLQPQFFEERTGWKLSSLTPRVEKIAKGSWQAGPPKVRGAGSAAGALEAALWAFANTTNYRDAVLLVTRLGGDTDTTGAITGQLAGAYYGLHGIPTEWRRRIVWSDKIHALGAMLLAAGPR